MSHGRGRAGDHALDEALDEVAAPARSARRIADSGWGAYCDPDDDTQRRAGRSIVMGQRLVFNALVQTLAPLADALQHEVNRAQGDGRR